MVTIYGARGTAEAMIARTRRMHDRIVGSTPAGKAYRVRASMKAQMQAYLKNRPTTARRAFGSE